MKNKTKKQTVQFSSGPRTVTVFKGTKKILSITRTGTFARLPGWGWYECEVVNSKLTAVNAVRED